MRPFLIAASLAVLFLMAGLTTVHAQRIARPGLGPGGAAPPPKAWNQAEAVYVAMLDDAIAGPVGQSFPPLYTHKLNLTIESSLRGTAKPGETLVVSHAARQEAVPTFPVGKRVIVAINAGRVERLELADDGKLKAVTRECSLPLSWKAEGDKLVSPWAVLGDQAWPKEDAGITADLKCSITGRPALLCGPGLKLTVEPVPPQVKKEFSNPDGDGEYTITLTNTTKAEIAVPALLSQGDKILWEESLALICQDKAYSLPTSRGVVGPVTATKLAPGQSVSTTFNILSVVGPQWPQGGYRIEFQFCLGEYNQTKSFYYLSKHHDPLRAAATKAK
ncbi:MAG TPA: hypothetical protein VL096_20605 [Pirellulaceae bacterium]|nr:hypothetical protein [Pirellulaceae bacterium]